MTPHETSNCQPPRVGVIGSGDWLDGKCPVCGRPNPKRHGEQYKTCSVSCGRKLRFKTDAKTRETLMKNRYNCVGWHGGGKAEINNPNHVNSKAIRVRDPLGVVHEIKNITAWCRKNEQLFKREDNQNAKQTLWRRAQVGLTSIANGSRCSWFGWTAVCVFDIETDPLARRVALPSNAAAEARRTGDVDCK